MRRNFSFLIIAILGFLWLLPAQAQISNMAQAIDKAGAQLTLSQRILKDYALVVLDVKTSTNQKDLTDSIMRYDTILAELQGFAPAAVAKNELYKVEQAWASVKQIASGIPQLDVLPDLLAATDTLLAANKAFETVLDESYGNPSGHLIVLAEYQSMLAERMAALYMLKTAHVDEAHFTDNLNNVTFEFKLGLEELKGAEQNTGAIKAALKKADTQFQMLEFSASKGGKTTFPFVVSEAADKVADIMDNVAHDYAKLAANS